MQGNDTANIGQTDACAFKFLLWMEPLENAKEPVDKVHVKPHAIVSDKKDIFTSILPASYLDFGAGTRACEFDGIRDEIGKHELQQRLITTDNGQLTKFPCNVPPERFL